MSNSSPAEPDTAAASHAALIEEGLAALEEHKKEIRQALYNGLGRYLTDRQETGGFLRAVLENDFMAALGHAHYGLTLRELKTLQQVIVGTFPSSAWGSKETVTAWLAAGKDEAPES